MSKTNEIKNSDYVAHHKDQEVRVDGEWITENVLGLGDTEDEAISNGYDNAGHNSIDRDEIVVTEV